jgi:hypothetical protein
MKVLYQFLTVSLTIGMLSVLSAFPAFSQCFQASFTTSAGNGPVEVTVNDFNADGKPDLATSNAFGDNISVLLGQGEWCLWLTDAV